MTGLEAYQIYNALKLHYTDEKFDAYKYNFKIRVSPRSFEALRYRYTFEKLGAKHNKDFIIDYLTSNMIEDVLWIHDMKEENYNKRQTRLQALTYLFKEDLNFFKGYDFDELCICKNGNNMLIDAFCAEKINIETVSIIDSLVNFIKPLLPKLNDPLKMKGAQAMKAMKYKSSLTNTNMKKMREILISFFTSA
tara:strand:+ start:288 stop:866 length:579 start_codon:yes stop_codon:yes gene_type:complete